MNEKPINCFPTYERVWSDVDCKFHNMYRGVDLGKGGWVYSEPGIYSNIALLDVASLHPTSIVMLNKLGKYTQRYADLRQARVYIKHGDYESAGKLFDGKLKPYLKDKETAGALSAALKLPLNSFFGVSFANFDNPARDSRDQNNIIALRGALFMKTLFDEVVARGYKIIHVKTDSCKVVNADKDIVQFIQEFAKKYGYEMEHEATYERICLLDKAQYVAAYASPEFCEDIYGYIPSDNLKHFKKHDHPWTTTGDAFQQPYIFKTLFSGEPIEFQDRCTVNTVKTAIYLDMNEDLPDVSDGEKEAERRKYNAEHPDERPKKLSDNFKSFTDEDLKNYISKGHDYQFIGRNGNFFPVRPGVGGGILYRTKDGKYDSVAGSKGFRWMEAERVKEMHMEDEYDPLYFDKMIDDVLDAVTNLKNHEPDPTRFSRFIDLSKPYEERPSSTESSNDISTPSSPTPVKDPFTPPWIVPCGDEQYRTCAECPDCTGNACKKGYSLCAYIADGRMEDDELPF